METLIAILRVYDWGGDRGSLMAIDASIVAAYGNAEKLAEIEQACWRYCNLMRPFLQKSTFAANLPS